MTNKKGPGRYSEKPKTYIVAYIVVMFVEEDAPPVFRTMTGDEIREQILQGNEFTILEGKLLKDFDSRIDATKL